MSPPSFHLRFSVDGSVVARDKAGSFKRESGFEVGGEVVERSFSSYFSPELADLVDVAMAVYTADRVCPRRPSEPHRYDHYWHRRITLEIPVRRPECWTDPIIQHHLDEALTFLTEDDWELKFRSDPGFGRVVQGHLFPTRPASPVVALFSGGLDSYAGLCAHLMEAPGADFVLFAGHTNRRLKGVQRTVLDGVADGVEQKIIPVLLPFGIRRGDSSYNEDENTQRTRGFVHSALGAATALTAGANALFCYENGIGGFNLPITPAQLGTQNARSAHPTALSKVAQLVEAVTGRSFSIRMPYLFKTKAEICRSISEVGLSGLIETTVSCDGFPRRVKGSPQCGVCTSCLLRRQALHASGLSRWDSGDGYQDDVKRRSGSDSSLPYELRGMLDQVWRIRRALSQPQPWKALAGMYPQLEQTALNLASRGEAVTEVRMRILELYRKYCREWDAFAQPTLPFDSSAA